MAEQTKLSIDSDLAQVAGLGARINRICTKLGMDDIGAYQVEVCVVEAVNNVIEHAYGNEAGHKVETIITFYPRKIHFTISDTGKSADLSGSSDLEFDPDNLDTIPESGMGLFIIRKVMDEVDQYSQDGQNIFTMTKYL